MAPLFASTVPPETRCEPVGLPPAVAAVDPSRRIASTLCSSPARSDAPVVRLRAGTPYDASVLSIVDGTCGANMASHMVRDGKSKSLSSHTVRTPQLRAAREMSVA
eukprot:6691137-Prymnesium_polylepis.4